MDCLPLESLHAFCPSLPTCVIYPTWEHKAMASQERTAQIQTVLLLVGLAMGNKRENVDRKINFYGFYYFYTILQQLICFLIFLLTLRIWHNVFWLYSPSIALLTSTPIFLLTKLCILTPWVIIICGIPRSMFWTKTFSVQTSTQTAGTHDHPVNNRHTSEIHLVPRLKGEGSL